MIQITKHEASLIRAKLPEVPIKRTVNHYYVEEDRSVLALLNKSASGKKA